MDPAQEYHLFQQTGRKAGRGKNKTAEIKFIAGIKRDQQKLPTYKITIGEPKELKEAQFISQIQEYKGDEVILIRKRIAAFLLAERMRKIGQDNGEIIILIKKKCMKATAVVLDLVEKLKSQDSMILVNKELMMSKPTAIRKEIILEKVVAIWVKPRQEPENRNYTYNEKYLKKNFIIHREKEPIKGEEEHLPVILRKILKKRNARSKEIRKEDYLRISQEEKETQVKQGGESHHYKEWKHHPQEQLGASRKLKRAYQQK